MRQWTNLDAVGTNGGRATVSTAIRSEVRTPSGEVIEEGRPGTDENGLYKHIADGTRRCRCRALWCSEFTWLNIYAGYCAMHLLRHLRGSAVEDKPDFPPMPKECCCGQR